MQQNLCLLRYPICWTIAGTQNNAPLAEVAIADRNADRQDNREEADLRTPAEKCTQCFPSEANTVSHSALSAEMAARIYGNVHETGNLPAMCQQDNGRFFICYEPNDASQRGTMTSWP